MAVEKIQQGYYYPDSLRWIDIHNSAKICLEQYFAKALFRGDLTRVIYSTPDITFRRRTDLLDESKIDLAEDFSPVALSLPYASYYQTSDWENDDRPASTQAGQILVGQYSDFSHQYVRSRAVKSTFSMQIFFSRRDDVRLAAQLLSWEATPKGPARLYTGKGWRGTMIGIPVFVTIEKIDTHPNWKSRDWLEKQKIYPIDVECTVRSYEVFFNKFDNVVTLPVRFSPTHADLWDDETNNTIYLTEEVDLDFFCEKFDWKKDVDSVDLADPVISLNAPKYFEKDGPFTADELKAFVAKLPSDYTHDIMRAYFSETTEVAVNVLSYNEHKTVIKNEEDKLNAEVEAWIDLRIKPADYKYFDRLEFLVPAHDPVVVKDCKADHFTVPGLYPRSTYKCNCLVYSVNGNVTTLNLAFTTPDLIDEETGKSENPAPTPTKINRINPLVGRHI